MKVVSGAAPLPVGRRPTASARPTACPGSTRSGSGRGSTRRTVLCGSCFGAAVDRCAAESTEVDTAGRHRVDASRVPGTAAQQPPHRQHTAHEQPVHPECLDGVSATTGIEAATWRQRRRHPPLVTPDQHDERNGRPGHGELAGATIPIARSARSISRPRAAESAVAEPGRARMTTRDPGGSVDTRPRIRCRRRRATRCRTTEPPTALLTTKPIRGPGGRTAGSVVGSVEGSVVGSTTPGSARSTCITTSLRPIRRPRRTVAAKSSRWVSRAAVGSNARRAGSGGQLLPALTTTRRKDCPTRAGAHPQAEPVGTGATAVVRLKRALALGHCSAPVRLPAELCMQA